MLGSRHFDAPAATGAVRLGFWLLLGLLVLLVLATGPVLTSDGPTHVAMAQVLLRAGDPAWPMLNRVYELNPGISPNALAHRLLAGLLRVMSPAAAEAVVQILCLMSLPLAGLTLLQRLAPAAGWLALFLIPVALQRLFFAGLYNYCLSAAGALLCLAAFLRLREKLSVQRVAALAAALLLTLACQAFGWLAAGLAIGILLLADPRCGWRLRGATAIAALPGLLLFLSFAMNPGPDRLIDYGDPFAQRLLALLRADFLAPIGRPMALLGGVCQAMLAVLYALGLWRWRQGDRPLDPTLARGLCLLPPAFLLLALAIPDRAGGAWTHSLRAQPFPMIALLLAVAVLPIAPALRRAVTGFAALTGLLAIATAAWVEAVAVPPAVQSIAVLDRRLAPHCTVAPAFGHYKLDAGNTARLFHHPMFHAAARLQLREDRPVLFSYLARLQVYPVRFRPTADPQRLLYGWAEGQRDTRIDRLDLEGYRRASGVPVDVVLLWGFAADDARGAGLRTGLLAAGYAPRPAAPGAPEPWLRPGAEACLAP